MLDRSAFLRPIAHRGLHKASEGVIENTAPAFQAAIDKGYGIECDLRPAADGTPMVFHDLALSRLVDARGKVSDYPASELARLRYRRCDTPILTFDDLIDLVDARVPLLVEIKSEWDAADPAFLRAIARQAKRAKGPLALMSFDPAVMTAMRELAPRVPRGIVSGHYQGDGWWLDRLDRERAYRLTHLLESGPAAPGFFAYHVRALPTPVTRFVRECLEMPLFAWTVRTPADLAVAKAWADAPIFEDLTL